MIVAGAVLCGGASRRMGRDKALIELGGVPLAERVARVLEAAACDPVVFVGGDRSGLAVTGRPWVADEWPGAGPVGGVITALRAQPDADAVVVCACDLVDLTTSAVRAVVPGAMPWVDVVRVADSGHLEPMLACWNPAMVGDVATLFERGLTSLHGVIAAVSATTVAVDPAALRNANTLGDLGD